MCATVLIAAGPGDDIQGCCQSSRHTLSPHSQEAGTADGTTDQPSGYSVDCVLQG